MTPETRRTVVRHAIALDLVVVATGAALLAPDSPLVVFAVFLAAVAVAAWAGGEEVGLAATVWSAIALSLFFRNVTDAQTLTGFALIGTIFSALARAARGIRREDAAKARHVDRATVAAIPFSIGLPLLAVVVYTNISDALISQYAVPSLLQPVIALLTVVVFIYRKRFRPADAALQPVVILLACYALVVFATGIWAVDITRVDNRFAEAMKAVVVCILAASLTISWRSLRAGIAALVMAATIFAAISIVQVMTGAMTNLLGGIVHLQTGNIYGDFDAPRASGPPVADPNFYGRILLVIIPLAFALAVVNHRRSRRFAWAGAGCVITAGALLTYSRGAMLAIAAMAALMLVAARVRLITLAGLSVAAIVLMAFLSGGVAKRFATLTTLWPGDPSIVTPDPSLEMRKLYVRAGLRMFSTHPWTGVGAGNFGRHYFEYANVVGSPEYDFHPAGTTEYPHGLWLEIASETGIIGLLTFGSAIIAAFVSLWKARSTFLMHGETSHAAIATGIGIALVGYLIASGFLHETYLRYVGLYVGLVAGIARLAHHHIREDAV